MSDFVPSILTNKPFVEKAGMPDDEILIIDYTFTIPSKFNIAIGCDCGETHLGHNVIPDLLEWYCPVEEALKRDVDA